MEWEDNPFAGFQQDETPHGRSAGDLRARGARRLARKIEVQLQPQAQSSAGNADVEIWWRTVG